jgi:ubiquitin carboxyl-terminal hydrolase L5
MSHEWCTIESDPGVFTELIKNIGVKGVQVEEIINLDELGIEENVYGVIFLFKFLSKTNYKPNVIENYDQDLYFAKQTITNACATQAILAILMNNDDKLDVGDTLKDLKAFTKDLDPSLKGECFSNCEKVKTEHNKFAK